MCRISFFATLLCLYVVFLPESASAQQPGYQSASTANSLPDEFRGKISYFGNHSGEVISTRAGDVGKPSSDCARPDRRCPVRIGGSLQVDLEFDGVVVRGSFRGSGGLRDSGLIGRRQGSQCRLFDLTDGSVWAGHCDREGFVGTVKSVAGAGTQLTLSFEAVGTKTNDYAESERQRRQAQQIARRIEYLKSVILGNDPVEDRVLASVELDSFGWIYDRLLPDTLAISRRIKGSRGSYTIEVTFSLDSGKKGWARARIDREAILCVEFWDYPGNCRAVKAPPPAASPTAPLGDERGEGPQSSLLMPPPLTIPRSAYGV